MIAFDFNGVPRRISGILKEFKVITPAASLGHDESLILYLSPQDERTVRYPEPHKKGFFRFSVGLEDTGDLRQAMSKVGA